MHRYSWESSNILVIYVVVCIHGTGKFWEIVPRVAHGPSGEVRAFSG